MIFSIKFIFHSLLKLFSSIPPPCFIYIYIFLSTLMAHLFYTPPFYSSTSFFPHSVISLLGVLSKATVSPHSYIERERLWFTSVFETEYLLYFPQVYVTLLKVTVTPSNSWKFHNYIFFYRFTNLLCIYTTLRLSADDHHFSPALNYALSMDVQCLCDRTYSPLSICPDII